MKIKFNNPFDLPGNWYKGNLHTHTTNSDGDLSPKETIEMYKNSGYDFLAITDHNELTRVVAKQDLLLIPGEEIDCGKTDIGTNFHLVGINLKKEITIPEGMNSSEIPPEKIVEQVHSNGGIVILAHPYWSALVLSDMLSFEGYIGVEVFNTSTFYSIDKGYSCSHWDDLLNRGKNVYGLAVDDAHYHFNEYRPNDICGSSIVVKSKELSIKHIMDSIKQGLFYSTSGPVIKHLDIKSNKIFISCSPVKTISFISPDGGGRKFTSPEGKLLEKIEYEFKGKEKYIRIECSDTAGRRAFTNPIWFMN